MNLTKSIPEAIVPELILPYTEEECAALPPEEFPESDEEIEDVSDAEGAEAGNGSNKVAEDVEKVADDVAENVNASQKVAKDAEKVAEAENVGDV